MLKPQLTWPLPAILTWLSSWLLFYILQVFGLGVNIAFATAVSFSVVCSFAGSTRWRKGLITAGFPVSFLLTGSTVVGGVFHSSMWLLPLALLLIVYPVRAWRDAPFFPTPGGTLTQIRDHVNLVQGAKVLDAGCGLGHGLRALRNEFPTACLFGVEWSWPLCWVCRLLCPWAHILRADLWKFDWSDFDMVYLFQRPESMQKAADKAAKELKAGAWLVSLEFEAIDLVSTAEIQTSSGKMMWLYQAPLKQKSQEIVNV